MNKTIFHKFDPIIYPTNLWVCKKPTVEEFLDFFDFDNSGLPANHKLNYDPNIFAIAQCIPVIHKESKEYGIVCVVIRKSEMSISVCAHEAIHIADYIYESCSMETQSFTNRNEPYAYLVGWATDCIEQVVKNKFK